MAIDVPTTSRALNRLNFAFGEPVRSGEDAADEIYGFAGVNSEANFCQAHLRHVLCNLRKKDGSTLWSTLTTTLVALPKTQFAVGKHFTKIELTAEITDGFIQLDHETATSAESTLQAGKGIKTINLTLGAHGGDPKFVRVKARADVALAALFRPVIIHSLLIVEMPLVAADFTW